MRPFAGIHHGTNAGGRVFQQIGVDLKRAQGNAADFHHGHSMIWSSSRRARRSGTAQPHTLMPARGADRDRRNAADASPAVACFPPATGRRRSAATSSTRGRGWVSVARSRAPSESVRHSGNNGRWSRFQQPAGDIGVEQLPVSSSSSLCRQHLPQPSHSASHSARSSCASALVSQKSAARSAAEAGGSRTTGDIPVIRCLKRKYIPAAPWPRRQFLPIAP
jgi:hypothetical protein